jgi:hypothetical protein
MSPERWTSEREPLADLPGDELAHLRRRARWGLALMALGIGGILWGVLHLLLAVGGPEQADFAHRPRYDEVKPVVQREMFGALVRAVAGLFVAMAGGSLRASARRRLHSGRP